MTHFRTSALAIALEHERDLAVMHQDMTAEVLGMKSLSPFPRGWEFAETSTEETSQFPRGWEFAETSTEDDMG